MPAPKSPPKTQPRDQAPSGKLFEQIQNQAMIFSDLVVEMGEEKVAEVHIEVTLRNGTTIMYSKDLITEEMMKDNDDQG